MLRHVMLGACALLGAAPALFQLGSFRELGRPFDVRAVFGQVEYQRWNAMRQGLDYYAHGRDTAAMLEKLAAEKPAVLACMHGSAFKGDGAALLRALGKRLN